MIKRAFEKTGLTMEQLRVEAKKGILAKRERYKKQIPARMAALAQKRKEQREASGYKANSSSTEHPARKAVDTAHARMARDAAQPGDRTAHAVHVTQGGQTPETFKTPHVSHNPHTTQTIETRVDKVEAKVDKVEAVTEAQEERIADVELRLTRVEAQLARALRVIDGMKELARMDDQEDNTGHTG